MRNLKLLGPDSTVGQFDHQMELKQVFCQSLGSMYAFEFQQTKFLTRTADSVLKDHQSLPQVFTTGCSPISSTGTVIQTENSQSEWSFKYYWYTNVYLYIK